MDIATTGDTLAKKDAEDEATKAFYKELGITMNHVIDIENRFRSSSQLERDRKIGAAGELYVSCPTHRTFKEVLN